MATFFHIKANDGSSRYAIGSTAFDEAGPATLVVDANAFLISETGGYGAKLTGSGLWNVTIGLTDILYQPQ